MATITAALILAAALVWAAARIGGELQRGREEQRDARQLSIAALFAPAIEAAHQDPQSLLTWQPLAKALRARFPAEFAALDAASGATFPFTKEFITSAHSRWTADWLTWEKSHDAIYKAKALAVQHELGGDVTSAAGRARLDEVEREKLELYQRRYETYVRVGKALQALAA